MLRQRRPGPKRFRIDWFKAAVATAIVLGCLCAPCALAQRNGTKANGMPEVDNPVLSTEILIPDGSMMESGIRPKAIRMYWKAVQELHNGQDSTAEKDARRAVRIDAKFADADALAATAALAQRQFSRARAEACHAVHINANDEKAWVVLATADNYLGKYAEAVDALGHVRQADRSTWQVAYQWARAEAGEGERAEAGQDDAAQTLDWANRAALTAPSGFAPLHLLRASALLAAGSYSQSADELEIYLQLLGGNAPERKGLTSELHRLRELAQNSGVSRAAAGGTPEHNALAN